MLSNKSLSTKLTISYGLLHLIISLFIITTTYFLISSSLINKDHEVLESEVTEYQYQFNSNGLKGIQDELKSNLEGYQDIGLIVALYNRNGELIYTIPSEDRIDDAEALLIKEMLVNSGPREVINTNAAQRYFDFTTLTLDDSFTLKLAIDTTKRHELISNIRLILIAMFIISLLMGLIIGKAVTNKNLRPIKDLIETIKVIQEGQIHARVSVGNNKDELALLSTYFNSMIDKVQRTVNGMKSAIDSISHDLRTPLTRLKVLLELSLRDDKDQAELRKTCENGLEITNDLESLINTLLDISEASSGILKMNFEIVSLKSITDEVIELYEYVSEEKNLTISTSIADIKIMADQHRIKQAFANLLDNAIKYSHMGGHIIFLASEGASSIDVLIKDNGIGIEPANLPLIWNRFYREDASRSLPGLGLGLSLVKSIIQSHNADIIAYRDDDDYTTFKISFQKLEAHR